MVKHHAQKQNVEERVYLLTFIVYHGRKSGQKLKQGRSLEAEAGAESTGVLA